MSKPIPCMPGFEQPNTGQTACIACTAGFYSNIPGTVDCQALPSGHYGTSERSVAIPCPKGTHVNAAGTGCDACTAG